MPMISEDADLCTIIVTVDGAQDAVAQILDHATDGLSIFAEFDGFVGGATHLADDGQRIIQYLQWRSAADHMACMEDPSWSDQPSSRQFMELMESGEITVDVRNYSVRKSLEFGDQ